MNFLRKLFYKDDKHTNEVLRKSASALVVKVIGMLSSFALSITLGRLLGADGLGVINLANTIIGLFIVICMLGTRQIIVKNVSIELSKESFKGIADTLKSAFFLNGIFTAILSVIFIVLTPLLVENIFNDIRLKWPLIIFLSVVLAQIVSRILSSALIAYRKIWQSSFVDECLSTLITLIAVGLIWVSGNKLTILNVALCYALGRITVMLFVSIYWEKIKTKVRTSSSQPLKLFSESHPLLMSSISNVLISNADVILIGMFLNAREVGLYTVASRLAMLTNFLLKITNSSLSGNLAALFEKGKKKELQNLVQNTTLYLIIIATSSLLFYYLVGEMILGLWGEEFKQSFLLLMILSVGQFFNISSGAAGQLLIMCGYHKYQNYITTSFMLINIILNLTLINLFGVLGAAITTMITVSGVNITRVIIAKKKTGILTIPANIFSCND